MIIQSTRVWVDEAFQKAQIEIQKGKITALYPYGEKAVDRDYGDWKNRSGSKSITEFCDHF